jgi:hypothetical protein
MNYEAYFRQQLDGLHREGGIAHLQTASDLLALRRILFLLNAFKLLELR